MTRALAEALRGPLTRAFASPLIRAVTAEALRNDGASQRVLEKAGFRRIVRRTGTPRTPEA